ncbi:uncharacterized protein LOC118740179 [Rhagoletis pomonella]|uniref:uncharacterized protein LOC118740179 n=1 Tax=Rhagoletis pomonella TaxID=28610 RepID=UPI00177F87FF|nr:uncharacterized protein LOC118740179 [Rhagoletis pomonella]
MRQWNSSCASALPLQELGVERRTSEKERFLYYRNVSYNYNPNHVASLNITTINSSQGVLIHFTPAHNITKNIWLDLAVLMKPLNADKFQPVLNFNLNGCALLRRSSGPNGFDIAKRWANNFLNSGSVPISCPVLKNNYTWSIYPTKKNGVPILQLEGFYRLIANLYFKRSKRIESFVNTSTTSELMYK